MFSLYLNDCALALDPIKDTRVVNRNVLFCNDLDDFLRYDTTSEGANVVQFGSTSSDTMIWLIENFLVKWTVARHTVHLQTLQSGS